MGSSNRNVAVCLVSVVALATSATLYLTRGAPQPAVAPMVEVEPPEARVPREALPPSLLAATSASVQDELQRLYLIETSPGRTPREGSARIGTDPRAPQRYAAGAILLNGARLTEIYNRHVVLSRGTERFRLELIGKGAEPSSPLAFVGGVQPVAAPPEPALDRLSDVLRMSPVYENDLLVGMRVLPGNRAATFSQIGLKPEDILVAVDGAPVADAAAMTSILEPLTTGAQMTLTVRRGSVVTSVYVDGGIIARELAPTTNESRITESPAAG